MSDTPSGSDTRPSLLRRLRDAQDGESWQTFVATYAPLVYRYCRRQGLQDADAADVTQDVLDQVARSIRTFEYRPERGRFRDWLGTVTRNKIARFHRRQSRELTGWGGDDTEARLEQVAEADADTGWTADFNARVLEVALGRVKPNFEPHTWRAFEQVWLGNRPAAEVANELGLAVDAIYVAKSRVLKQLRAEVLVLAEDLPHFVPLG